MEPTIQLDQLKRYLDHLNEIRRVNEGDDTADAPGYSLNLVRVPVSIMPGEQTRQGFGAEITVTAKPHVTPELLPRVFRELVINDLIDLLALPVLKVAEEFERINTITPVGSSFCQGFRHYQHVFLHTHEEMVDTLVGKINKPAEYDYFVSHAYKHGKTNLEFHYSAKDIKHQRHEEVLSVLFETLKVPRIINDEHEEIINSQLKDELLVHLEPVVQEIAEYIYNSRHVLDAKMIHRAISKYTKECDLSKNELSQLMYYLIDEASLLAYQDTDFDLDTVFGVLANSAVTSVSSNLTRNARHPLPPSQVIDVFGLDNIVRMGYEFWKTTQYSNTRHLMDAQGFLKEQLESSYDYLKTPEGAQYWQFIPKIHEGVRSDILKFQCIEKKDGQLCLGLMEEPKHEMMPCPQVIDQAHGPGFILQMSREEECDKEKKKKEEQEKCKCPCIRGCPDNPFSRTPITMGAWWVLVESALLNERLNDDMRRVSQDPDCFCHHDEYHAFYGPVPSEEARMAFVDYVNCRWPIHVFALDPVTQQQNIADTFSMRREMQLAMALAFASGKMKAQNMLKYARRLELDMETVALNHTVAGFGHGTDTFGWRFMPRVQTPPFESNAKVIFRDMLWGGPSKDALRKCYEIEPGMRECVAIVLMPSFLEHLTFHTRGNYFKLNNYKRVKSTMVENACWSKDVRELEMTLQQLHCEADLYRHGEVERVYHRVEQLGKKLPLQTVHAKVPNENTLGGFEMFSSGITDLGPELYGFYGTPGINPDQQTTIYLVGNHFSVHETRVLAGNRNCEFRLLSRQVMEVKVPPGVQVVRDKFSEVPHCPERHVDIHVSTPYGVSRRLEVPVLREAPGHHTSHAWSMDEIQVNYEYEMGKKVTNCEGPNCQQKVNSLNIIGVSLPHELSVLVPINKCPRIEGEETPKVKIYLKAVPNSVSGGSAGVSSLLPPLAGKEGDESRGINNIEFIYDKCNKALVCSAENYNKLHCEIRNSIQSHVTTLLENATSISPQYTFEITGTVGGEVIANKIRLTAILREKAK